MEFSRDDYNNKSFNELINKVMAQDAMIKKLNNKLQKKRLVISDFEQEIQDLKKEIEYLKDKKILNILFDDDDDDDDTLSHDNSEEDKNNFTDEQFTNSMGFFNDYYEWLPPELLYSDKRCMTSIKHIYDDLKEWSRDEGLSVQGSNRQILKRPQLIQFLREEHKNIYNNHVKWEVSQKEGDSEKYVNGSRNIPYFHCMKKQI
jgi:hypothetical protein